MRPPAPQASSPGISEMRELDRTDLKILDLLQKDGRLSMTELAQRIGGSLQYGLGLDPNRRPLGLAVIDG